MVEQARPVSITQWVNWTSENGDACTAAFTKGAFVQPWEPFGFKLAEWNEIVNGDGEYLHPFWSPQLHADVGEPRGV